jgi:hypothetical protein
MASSPTLVRHTHTHTQTHTHTLSVSLSLCLSVSLSFFLPISISFYLSLYLSLSFYLSLFLSLSLSLSLFLSLSSSSSPSSSSCYLITFSLSALLHNRRYLWCTCIAVCRAQLHLHRQGAAGGGQEQVAPDLLQQHQCHAAVYSRHYRHGRSALGDERPGDDVIGLLVLGHCDRLFWYAWDGKRESV